MGRRFGLVHLVVEGLRLYDVGLGHVGDPCRIRLRDITFRFAGGRRRFLRAPGLPRSLPGSRFPGSSLGWLLGGAGLRLWLQFDQFGRGILKFLTLLIHLDPDHLRRRRRIGVETRADVVEAPLGLLPIDTVRSKIGLDLRGRGKPALLQIGESDRGPIDLGILGLDIGMDGGRQGLGIAAELRDLGEEVTAERPTAAPARAPILCPAAVPDPPALGRNVSTTVPMTPPTVELTRSIPGAITVP